MNKLFSGNPGRTTALIAGMTVSNLLEGVGFSLVVPLFQQLLVTPQNENSFTVAFRRAFEFFRIPMSVESVLIVLVVAFTLKTIVALVVKSMSVKYGGEYLQKTQTNLFRSILSARLNLFGRTKQGLLINALATETVKVANAYVFWTQWISSLIAVAVYVVLALKMSGGLAIVSAALGFAALFPLKWISARALKYGRETTSLNEQIQTLLTECFSGVKFIKGGAREEKVSSLFTTLVDSYRTVWQKTAFNSNLTATVAQPIAVAVLSLILFSGLKLGVPFAEMLVFLIIFQRLMPTIAGAQNTRNDFNALIGSVEKIDQLANLTLNERERAGGNASPEFHHSIEFKGVSFQYPDGHKVFSDLFLSIPAHKTTALLGQSGGGKTTLVDLIMGFYSPQNGKVLIDNIDLETISLAEWRGKISYVSQDVVLFHDTISENLKWDSPQATQEEIEAAAKLAHAHTFISSFEKGYQTIIGDRGFRLSGGQRQRLALARAILKKPKILILDEATSALDVESESLIAASLQELRKRGPITIIIIAHRLTTVKNADHFLTIGNGKATEVAASNL